MTPMRAVPCTPWSSGKGFGSGPQIKGRTFFPMTGLPTIYTPGTPGSDCFAQVEALMNMDSSYKAVIGTVFAYCRDLDDPDKACFYQKPWQQHCWVIDQKGRIHDPAIRNLSIWAERSGCELLSPVEEMKAVEVDYSKQRASAAISQLVTAPLNRQVSEPLVYFPGYVVRVPNGLQELPLDQLEVWAKAAIASVENGGFALQQLSDCLLHTFTRIAVLEAAWS